MLPLLFLALVASPALARQGSFIIGGDDVSFPGKYPHQGSLEYFGSHNCGCVLISRDWVLTAAHCVGGSTAFYTVVLGQHNRFSSTVGDPTDYDVAQIIKHPSYGVGAGAFPNDIAVMKLSQPANTGSIYISTISLASGSNDYAGQECIITGWGRTSGGGSLPAVLQEANTVVLSNSDCEGFWGSNVNDGHVCIRNYDENKGSCNGDSGGPLQCGNTLVGITSWGASGCSTFYPAGYSRVSFFRDWIRQNTGV